MKFMRNIFLLLLAAVLAFGGTGAAWGATVKGTLATRNPSIGIGKINPNPVDGGYMANVYYLSTATFSATNKLVLVIDFSAEDVTKDNDGVTYLADGTGKAVWKNAAGTEMAASADCEIYTDGAVHKVDEDGAGAPVRTTIELDAIPDQPATYMSYVTDSNGDSGSVAALKLTFIAVTPVLSGDAMEFTLNSGDTRIRPVTALPSEAASASFDLSISNLPSWAAVVLTSRDISISGTPSVPAVTPVTVSASKIEIAADPYATVAGVSSAAPVEIGTFSIIVPAPYKLVLKPSTVSGDVAHAFDEKVGITVLSEDEVIDTPLSKLVLVDNSGGTAVETDTINEFGLTIFADASNRTISVRGTPTESFVDRTAYIPVRAAFPSGMGAITEATLTVRVRRVANYILTLKPSYFGVAQGKFFMQDVSVSLTGSPSITLSGLRVAPSGSGSDNDIAASVETGLKTIWFEGTPRNTGVTRFTVQAIYGSYIVAEGEVAIHVTEDIGGEAIDDNPYDVDIHNKIKDTVVGYNDNNFRVGIPQQLYVYARAVLNNVKVSMQGPYDVAPRTLVEGRDYTLKTTMSGMTISINVTPDYRGLYTFHFSYDYGGVTYTDQSVTLNATTGEITPSGDNDDGGGGSCSSFGPAAAGLALSLGVLLRRKR